MKKDDDDSFRLLLCFFHFSQALWRRAGEKGLREQEILSTTKNLIVNLQLISFLDIPYKMVHYEGVKEEFSAIDEKFSEFFWIF